MQMRLKQSATRRELFFGACFSAVALVLIACWVACSSRGPSTNSGPPPPAALGGSDYGWYHLDPPCSREPYGVVYNYDTASGAINSQLQQMYTNGQRRLRIPIYFA